ncbi:Protein CBG25745 [Caenorhabditis briggsae]|uniref:Protein CBG25745 n=1 Tax=Caenorhabditis briggsae TaxID=6238 RepID=B6IHR6_CAEBR|nr:Protein CBG25745 [Caenorhabditis briggsae]CAR99446.1 Protein CBG25745 [Caenorhabditis briggsae]
MLKTLLPLLTLAALCLGQYCPRGKKVSMKDQIRLHVKVKYPNKYAYLPRFFTESNEDWLAYPTEEDVGSHDIYVLVKGCKNAMLLELIVYNHHSPMMCEQPIFFIRKDDEDQKMSCCNSRSSHLTAPTTINGEGKEVLQIEEIETSEAITINEEKEVLQNGSIEATTEAIQINKGKEVFQTEDIDAPFEATSKTREAETRGRMEEIVAPFEAIPITEEPTMKESLQFEDIESSSSISSDKKSEKNEVFQMEESEATTEAIQINKGKEVFQTEDIEAPFEAIPNTEEPKIKESLQIEGIVNEEKEALQNGNIEYFAEIIPITPSSSPTFSSPTMTSSLLPPHGTTISTTLSESKNEVTYFIYNLW